MNSALLLLSQNKSYDRKVFIDDSIQPHRFIAIKNHSSKLNMENKYQFNYVQSYKKANIILFLVNSRENLINLDPKYDYIFRVSTPIIILERQDSAITWCRELSKIKNLRGIFKNRIMRDINMQNTENTIYGKYNYFLQSSIVKSNNLITEKRNDIGNKFYKENTILPKIEKEDLNKIKCVLWDLHSSPFKEDKENEYIEMSYFRNKEIVKDKTYDIFCINQFKDNNFVDDPRKLAKDIVNGLSNKYSVLTNSKAVNSKEYRKLFEQSKICVACWGFGEWVHMDAYAMYAGVILIKPHSDHVLMYPDIYKSYQTYIPCNHDYSNLKEVIIDCLENYDKYKDMLIKNRNILKSINIEMICKEFWKSVFKN